MRRLMTTLGLVLALVFATPALAQDKSGADAPAAAPAPADSPMTAAVQSVFQVFLYETGLLDGMIQRQVPNLRANITQSPDYQTATAAQRAALDHVVDTFPEMMREEVDALLPRMSANAAGRLTGVLAAEDINSFVAFARTPEFSSALAAYVQNYVRDPATAGDPMLTADQERVLRQFARTRSGRAVTQHVGDLFGALLAEMTAVTPDLMANIETRTRNQLCDAFPGACVTAPDHT